MAVVRFRDQKIERIYLKELTKEQKEKVYNIKNGPNAGKSMAMFKDKTHKISLKLVDGDWFEVGHTTVKDDYPAQWRKELDGEWTTINEGALICFKANENISDGTKYNSKIISESFDMIENGPEDTNPFIYNPSGSKSGDKGTDSGGKKKWDNYDPKGQIKGNAFNCAMILADYDDKDLNIEDNMKRIYLINQGIQSELPKLHGASIGMSITNACHITKDIDKVESMAISLLNSYIQSINDWVDSGAVDDKPEVIDDVEIDPVIDDDMEDLPF